MAIDYATQQHAGQVRRVDGAPFIQHPLEVAYLLHDAGAPDHVIASGVLHDTIEKTGTSSSDLRGRFGSRVEMLVLAVSEDERITDYQARKAALRQQVATAGRDALMVFAADKISKARELNLELATNRESIEKRTRAQRIDHYRQCLVIIEEHLADARLVHQLEEEFDKLTAVGDRRPLLVGSTDSLAGPR